MAMKLPFAPLPPSMRVAWPLQRPKLSPTAIPAMAGHLFLRIRSLLRYASCNRLLHEHYLVIGGRRCARLL